MKKALIIAASVAGLAGAMSFGTFAEEAVSEAVSEAVEMETEDSELTAEEIIERYREAVAGKKELSAKADGAMDITLAFGEQDVTLNMGGKVTMDIAAITDPLMAEVQAEIEGDMMGETMDAKYHVYMATEEDGKIPVYIGMDQGEGLEWAKTALDEDTVRQIKDIVEGGESLTALPVDFELMESFADDEEPAEERDVYSLITDIKWKDAVKIYETAAKQAEEASTEEQLPDDEALKEAGKLFDGVVLTVQMDVDASTFLPERVHIDFNESNWDKVSKTVAELFGLTDEDGDPLDISVSVDTLFLDYTYENDAPVEIEIPDEVVNEALDINSTSALADEALSMVSQMESEAAIQEQETGF